MFVVVLIISGCGSSNRSSTSSTSGAAVRTTGTTTTRAAVAAELDRLQEILPAVSATIPTPSATTVERNYLTAIAGDVQHVWGREFAASHLTYRPARVVVFANKVKSDCGSHDDSGPFYCPADESVYLDLRFFSELPDNAGVGTAAQGYIVAHEFAHHVQQLIGIAAKVADANRADPHGQKARSVQVELQADCLAGVWGRSAFPRSKLTTGDLDAALKAADVIGDDYIQQAAGQLIDSTLWTHGSSQQRVHWFSAGLRGGNVASCNTFASAQR